jgi:hypothetical protein
VPVPLDPEPEDGVAEPDEPESAALDELSPLFAAPSLFASLGVSAFDSPDFAGALPYQSAYHPPPFRMKPAPPDTWRFAVSFWQLGHVFRGAALMDCSASHAWPQAVHKYS